MPNPKDPTFLLTKAVLVVLVLEQVGHAGVVQVETVAVDNPSQASQKLHTVLGGPTQIKFVTQCSGALHMYCRLKRQCHEIYDLYFIS